MTITEALQAIYQTQSIKYMAPVDRQELYCWLAGKLVDDFKAHVAADLCELRDLALDNTDLVEPK